MSADRRYMTDTFYGIEAGERIRNGAFNEQINLNGDLFPVLSTRKKRYLMQDPEHEELVIPGGYISAAENNGLVTAITGTAETSVYKNGISARISTTQEQEIINFGRDNFLYPANRYIQWDATVKVQPVDVALTGFTFTGSATENEITFTPNNNQPEFDAFARSIRPGDNTRVTLFGVGNFKIQQNYIVKESNATDHYITVYGTSSSEEPTAVSDGIIERRSPVFDYAISHKNRIWGCRFGENDDGEFVNEIYGSALGDPLNYFVYEGTAADSFTASVGSGGQFTGIAALGDSVIFFKEDRYYILYGTEPPFTLREVIAEGVQIGSAKSICNINGNLYYKSNHGIMRMATDALPVCASDALGADIFFNATAGTDGKYYYVQMYDGYFSSGHNRLFKFDTVRGVWYEENRIPGLKCFVRSKNNLLALASEAKGTLLEGYYVMHAMFIGFENKNAPVHIKAERYDLYPEWEEDFLWTAKTGTLGLENPDYKEVKELLIRCKTGDETQISVYVEYDGNNVWEKIFYEKYRQKGTKSIRLSPPVQCDTYKLYIEGKGDFILYSLTQTIGEGGKQSVTVL